MSKVSPEVLTTQRLCLRALTLEDADFIRILLNDPSFVDNIGDRGVRTHEDARVYLRDGPISSQQKFGFSLYCVELKGQSQAIGICGLVRRAGLESPDLGYAFLPAFWGRGYAREAAAAVLRMIWQKFDWPHVLAVVSHTNGRSICLLEKLGFEFEESIQLLPGGSESSLYCCRRIPVCRRILGDEGEKLREIRLRALREDPLAYCSTYDREIGFPEGHWQERTTQAASGRESAIFLALRGKVPLGMAGVREVRPGVGEVWGVFVAAEMRGTSVGRKLMEGILDWALLAGLECLELEVNVDLKAAPALYEKLGFVADGRERELQGRPLRGYSVQHPFRSAC